MGAARGEKLCTPRKLVLRTCLGLVMEMVRRKERKEEGKGRGERWWSVLGMEEYALFDAGYACWWPWWRVSWAGGS